MVNVISIFLDIFDCEDNWSLMENKDDDNQDLLPVEIETHQSYLLNYEKNNIKEDITIIVVSFLIIISHLLNSFFNPGINLNHTQTIGMPLSSNINNITATYEITNIKKSNLFLIIGFMFSKNNTGKESHANVNLTSLIETSYNNQKVFEKGIHKQNIHLHSRKNQISSNFAPFFMTNQINFNSFNIIFAVHGLFDDFTKCLIEIYYASPAFTYFNIFVSLSSIILIISFLLTYVLKTRKIKGNHPYRPEFYFPVCLLLCLLLYILTTIIILKDKYILYYIILTLRSLATSSFFSSIIFYRNLSYPLNLKKDLIISLMILIIYFSIDIMRLLEINSVLCTISYFMRLFFSILSLFTTVKYEKASLKEYGNNLLFYSGFILLIGFAFNNKNLILLTQKYYNEFSHNILFSQTMLAYTLVVTYVLFPSPLENIRINDHQSSKQLTSYAEEKPQNNQ